MPRPAPHVVSEEPRAAWTTPRQPLHDAKTVAPTIDPSLAAARVYSYKKADPGAESRFLPQLASDAAPPDEASDKLRTISFGVPGTLGNTCRKARRPL